MSAGRSVSVNGDDMSSLQVTITVLICEVHPSDVSRQADASGQSSDGPLGGATRELQDVARGCLLCNRRGGTGRERDGAR